jgi:O-succinylbenzoic acid--CoA ligase
MTDIPCPLAEAARKYMDLPALITDNRIISYDHYDRLVESTASRLKDADIATGERVAIISTNTIEYPILLMALFRIGAVACPVSSRLPHQMVSEYFKRIRCSKIFDLTNGLHIDESLNITTMPIAEIIDFAETGAVLSMSLLKNPKLSAEQQIPSTHRHSRESGNPEESTGMTSPAYSEDEGRLFQHSASDRFISLDQEATIIATSGTSARPKAVLHTYGNHYYSAAGSNRNIKVHPGDRWLLSLPLYHVGGLAILFRTMLGGGAVVMANKDTDLLDTIRHYHVTHLSLVHTQLYRLLRKESHRDELKGISALLVGGSAMLKTLVTQAYEYGLPLLTSYGLTEMASQVTTTHPGDSLDRLLTSGKPLDYRQVRISSEGEILVKGDTLFRGYVEQDEVILPVDDDGWFHTGDIGCLDDAGYLTIRGRKDSMFISGGENIYPEEIEGVLCLLDYVSDAMVVPTKDDEFGFRPVAFIRTVGSKRLYESDLVTQLEQHLPRFKIPVRFYKWPETAQESDIKPSRRYFRELLLAASHELTELT